MSEKMKRLCFDTESNYFSGNIGVHSTDYSRAAMQAWRGSLRFDCAVVYDEAEDTYEEFTHQHPLIAKLETADELISHSGTRHDLLILERLCGRSAVAPLWAIRHHDLLDLVTWASLDNLARQHIPDDVLPLLEQEFDARLAEADVRWPGERYGSGWWYPREHFIAGKLAKARFDVQRTYLVFIAISRSLPGQAYEPEVPLA